MQNRRIVPIAMTIEECRKKKRRRNNVVFLEDEDIINPGLFKISYYFFVLEDVDPTVGRFRNLVQTAVVSNGKRKSTSNAQHDGKTKRRILLPGRDDVSSSAAKSYSSMLGISSISAAPSLDLYSNLTPVIGPSPRIESKTAEDDLQHKKKYAKEKWVGQKTHSVI